MPGTTSREPGQRADSCTAAMFHVKLFGGLIEPGKVTVQSYNYAARLSMCALGGSRYQGAGHVVDPACAGEPMAAYSCAGVVCSRKLCIAGRRPWAIHRDTKRGDWRHVAMSNAAYILYVAAPNRRCMRRITSPNSVHQRRTAMPNAAHKSHVALSAQPT